MSKASEIAEKITKIMDAVKLLNVDSENVTVNNDDFTVNIDEDVRIPRNGKVSAIPIDINYISGDFNCSDIGLESLENGPKTVDGWCDVSFNKLTSLDGAPIDCFGFDCSENHNLSSLLGCPEVNNGSGDLYCRNCNLTTLDGAPDQVGNFDCSGNKLKNLDGCPDVIGVLTIADNMELESFRGIPSRFKTLDISYIDVPNSLPYNVRVDYVIYIKYEEEEFEENLKIVEQLFPESQIITDMDDPYYVDATTEV